MLDIAAPESYVGGLLYLKPGYGWGWHRADGSAAPVLFDYEIVDWAGPFHIRVNRFFVFRDELRGVIGMIEQEQHFLHGYWTACGEMSAGVHNFTEDLSIRCDLSIGSAEPSGEWPLVRNCSPIYDGYGILAEDEDTISRYWDKRDLARGAKP